MKKLNFLQSFQNLLLEVQEIKTISKKSLFILENQTQSKSRSSNPDQEWISVKDACKILGCSEVTLWKLRKDNILPYSRLKRTIRFKKSDIFNYLLQNK